MDAIRGLMDSWRSSVETVSAALLLLLNYHPGPRCTCCLQTSQRTPSLKEGYSRSTLIDLDKLQRSVGGTDVHRESRTHQVLGLDSFNLLQRRESRVALY
jgi:hypothetical protein